MADENFQQSLFQELIAFFVPLLQLSGDKDALYRFLEEAGWDPEVALGDDGVALMQAVNASIDLVQDIKDIVDAPPESLTDVLDALGSTTDLIFAVRDLANASGAGPADLAELPADILNLLFLIYLHRRHRRLFHILELLTIVHEEPQSFVKVGNRIVRTINKAPRADLSRIADLLTDPGGMFENAYWPNGLPDRTEAAVVGSRLFPRIELVLRPLEAKKTAAMGFSVFAGRGSGPVELSVQEEESLAGMMTVVWKYVHGEFGDIDKLGASIGLLPENEGGPGVYVVPFGAATVSERVENGVLTLAGAAEGAGFEITKSGFAFFEGQSPFLDVQASWVPFRSPDAPAILIGSSNGTRFEVDHYFVKAGLSANDGNIDVRLLGGLRSAAVVITAGDSDGFLESVVPRESGAVTFDLEAGWSLADGFHIQGSGALEIRLPTHVDLGPISCEGVLLRFAPDGAGFIIEIGADLKGELGPLIATIENIGLQVDATFPRDGGNLGPVNLDPAFKWPTGVGLVLDSEGIKGGGFLEIDRPNHRYVGILQLEFQDTIDLTAIGLITTKLPDGKSGFSLLILITAEFQPIQLGMGFILLGVGGLLGLNRSMVLQVLREGVRDNSLKSILFPEDPVANATKIISDLRSAFPPAEGQFVIGPMAKLDYGTPTLISLELGLMIELPDPIRIAILGVLKAILPEENTALIKIQVNFIGTIDFDKGQLTFDASLFDSRLLVYDLAGDMAVRLYWKGDPQFLLSVGGFHPAFEPPPLNLPTLRRLSMQLLKGNNPRLRLETYLAITSNTYQFGARLELYAAAAGFNVYGFLAFDVLFQFSPFYFIASIGAMLALRRGSSSISSISLALTFEGTTPWKTKGTAKLKLFWFLTIKVRFSKTWGQPKDTLLGDVDVLDRLLEALRNKGNWQSVLPSQRHLLVSLKEIAPLGDQVVVHPVGGLTVSQKIVPLNVRIDKFGNAKPAGDREFAITGHQAGGEDLDPTEINIVKDHFAPADFFKKSDTEKLSADSFVKYDSGFSLGTSDELESSYYVNREVEYELSYRDSQREVRFAIFAGLLAPVAALFNQFSQNRITARSPLSFANNRISALAPNAVVLQQEGYGVANINDLTAAPGTVVMASEAEALDMMRRLQEDNPDMSGRLQVVPAFELNQRDAA